MPIDFPREILTSQYLDPAQSFQPRSYQLELRTDPLTGKVGTVFTSPIASRRYQPDAPAVAALVQKSRELGCPFCPETLTQVAPRFTPDFWPQGMIEKNGALIFPNRDLFHAPFSAVLLPGPQHYIELTQFSTDMLCNALEAAQIYFRRILEYQPRCPFHTVNWNYFPPAGGSIIHPHLQLLANPIPLNRHGELLEASRSYRRKNGVSYWAQLVEQEKERDERYIGNTGRVCWLSPFVPRGRLWDVMAALEGSGPFTELTSRELRDLCQGLVQVLQFIHEQGYHSFNFSLLSAVGGDETMPTIAFVLPRAITLPMGMSDCSYLDTLLEHPSSPYYPEQICRELRKFFP